MADAPLEDLVRQDWRSKAVNMFAVLSYSVGVGLALDMFGAGLTIGQSLRSRASMLTVNVIAGNKFVQYQDWMRRKCNVGAIKNDVGRRIATMATDTLASGSFYVPIYAATLYCVAGANAEQIKDGCYGALIMAPLVGPTFGMYSDLVRNVCGTTPRAKATEEEAP